MAALDDLNAAVTGAMMGDQLAEQQLLSHLTTMNQTLTAAAPIFETARQIPIATTLAQMNQANAENLMLGVTPLHQIQQEHERLKTSGIAANVSADIEKARFTQNLFKFQANVAEQIANTPAEQVTETQLQTLERASKLLETQRKVEEGKALLPRAGETALSIQTQAKVESDAAAAAAAAKKQAAKTMTQRFLWQPSLIEQQTRAGAKYEIEAFGRKKTAEEQANVLSGQQIRARDIELIPQEVIIEQFLAQVGSDPTGALTSLNTQMASYKSAVGGYPRLNTIMGELADIVVSGSPSEKEKAQQSMLDLNQGLLFFNQLQSQGIFLGLDKSNPYILATAAFAGGHEGIGQSILAMARSQEIAKGQQDEQAGREMDYTIGHHFKVPQEGITPERWPIHTDVSKLKSGGHAFVTLLIGMDDQGRIQEITNLAAHMANQPHLYNAVGYGWAPNANRTFVNLSRDANLPTPVKTAWMSGNKQMESVAYSVNLMPTSISRQYPGAIETAKGIAAMQIGKQNFDEAQADLMWDISKKFAGFGVTDAQVMGALNQPTSRQQEQALEQLSPGNGNLLHQLAVAYYNTQRPYTEIDIPTPPDGKSYFDEFSITPPSPLPLPQRPGIIEKFRGPRKPLPTLDVLKRNIQEAYRGTLNKAQSAEDSYQLLLRNGQSPEAARQIMRDAGIQDKHIPR